MYCLRCPLPGPHRVGEHLSLCENGVQSRLPSVAWYSPPFSVDAQLPPTLATWLGERGHAAAAVRDVGLRDSDDGSIWNFATAGEWTVITKDEDFVERCLGNPAAPAVVWLRVGNCTNRVLFALLDPLLPDILDRIKAGNRVVEVRRERPQP
ncbi:MAG: DUF5615 family PIN-like protein [Candidatus Hydrogenedentes bacterium]|nr:DUF5615 family PIN-like protein [Candidatus Hydrogenedentota bacterium]